MLVIGRPQQGEYKPPVLNSLRVDVLEVTLKCRPLSESASVA